MPENKTARQFFVNRLTEGVTLGQHCIEIWKNKFHNELVESDRLINLNKNIPRGYLQIKDIPSVIPHIFSDNQALKETFTALGFEKNPAIHNLNTRVVHFESGQKAYIFLMETTDPSTSKNIYYVTYLSRGPEESFLGQETHQDFSNLKKMNQLAEEKIKDEKTKEQFKFVKPLVLGITPLVDGYKYPFFTMPFLEGYGELRMSQRPFAKLLVNGQPTTAYLPYLSYAGPPIDQYESLHAAHLEEIDQIQNIALNLLTRYGTVLSEQMYYEYLTKLDKLPYFEKTKYHLLMVLVGNALIYSLTGGYFPKEFAINAGDWMADLEPEEMKLYLISIRGGLKKFKSDEEWIKHMRKHIDLPDDGGISSKPFATFTSEEIQSVLSHVRLLINQ